MWFKLLRSIFQHQRWGIYLSLNFQYALKMNSQTIDGDMLLLPRWAYLHVGFQNPNLLYVFFCMGGASCSLNSCRELSRSTHDTPGYLADTEHTHPPTHTHTHTSTHPVILGHGNATVRSRCVYSVWFPIWMCPSHGTVNGFLFPRAGQCDQTLSRSCQEGRRYQEEWSKSSVLLKDSFFQGLSRNWKSSPASRYMNCDSWEPECLLERVFRGLLLLALFYAFMHYVCDCAGSGIPHGMQGLRKNSEGQSHPYL